MAIAVLPLMRPSIGRNPRKRGEARQLAHFDCTRIPFRQSTSSSRERRERGLHLQAQVIYTHTCIWEGVSFRTHSQNRRLMCAQGGLEYQYGAPPSACSSSLIANIT